MALTQSQQAYYDGDNFGGYQVTSLQTIIDNFLAVYVGEGKLLQKTLAADVSFHAHRALQELSFDTLKSCKSQEIEVSPSLTMPLPQDYVNYIKLSWVDSSGIKHIIYPTSKTLNPKAILQNSDGDYNLTAVGTLVSGSSTIVLDASYTNILVGMTVSSPNITTTTVETTSTVGGITTITVAVAGGATYTGTETLSFSSPPDLLAQEANSLVLTGLTWTSGEDKITATSAPGVEVGMYVTFATAGGPVLIEDITGSVITWTDATGVAPVNTEVATFTVPSINLATTNEFAGDANLIDLASWDATDLRAGGTNSAEIRGVPVLQVALDNDAAFDITATQLIAGGWDLSALVTGNLYDHILCQIKDSAHADLYPTTAGGPVFGIPVAFMSTAAGDTLQTQSTAVRMVFFDAGSAFAATSMPAIRIVALWEAST